MINVLIDTGNAPPKSGIGVYAASLEDSLNRHLGDEVVAREAGVSSIGIGLRPVRRMLYLSRINLLARKSFGGADVAHFVNQYAPQGSQVPVVATIHDLDVMTHPWTYPANYRRYFSIVIRRTIRRADRLVTVSNAARKVIIEKFPDTEDRLSVTGNSLHPVLKKVLDTTEPPLDGLPYLLFVGKLEKKKNLVWFVQAFSDGLQKGAFRKMRLIIAGGKGFGFAEIKKAIDDAGPMVRWIESPNITVLGGLYVGAAAVVLPSLSEGFGIPLLEGMYCRKPIVASRIPSSLEVAGNAGYYFDLDSRDELYSALNEAIADKEAERRLKAAGERVEWFSPERFARSTVAVYHSALGTTWGRSVEN